MFVRKRIKELTLFLSILIFFVTFQNFSSAQFESLTGSAVLTEASTGRILYEKDANTAKPPASITKIMTLLLAFEAIEKEQAHWDDMVPVSEKAWRMEGSRMFLEVGTRASYRDIVTGISVVSANDGCVALAEYLYGSENSFVQIMNRKAQELGMTQTRFSNSTGLPDEDHYMSARDIAVLAGHIIQKYPELLEFESMREFTYNNIRQYNRNPLLGSFPGADGLKTGWTTEAGYCLVGTAMQNGIRMISVVLNVESEQKRLEASQELLNYGFKNFEFMEAVVPDIVVGELDVEDGKEMSVSVKVNEGITVLIPMNARHGLTYELKKSAEILKAPVEAGTPAGLYIVRFNGEIQASVPVITVEDVERAGFFERLLRRISLFFKNLFNHDNN